MIMIRNKNEKKWQKEVGHNKRTRKVGKKCN